MADESRPYQLYWHKTTSSLAPMAVLEEIGVAYEAVEIDVAAGEHKGAAFREIHPLGLMPALRLPDGRTVFESAGIAMFVSDRHPEVGIAPDPACEDRAFYIQWLFYLADAIFPTYGRYYRPGRFSTDPGDSEPIKARCAEHLVEQLAVVERALDGRDWLVGDDCTTADNDATRGNRLYWPYAALKTCGGVVIARWTKSSELVLSRAANYTCALRSSVLSINGEFMRWGSSQR